MANQILTQAEKDRFIQWLEQNAESNHQMLKVGESFLPEALRKKLNIEGVACLTVAKMLKQTETTTIGPGEEKT